MNGDINQSSIKSAISKIYYLTGKAKLKVFITIKGSNRLYGRTYRK